MAYDIHGVLVAHDSNAEINVEALLHDAGVTFVDTLASELLGGAKVIRSRVPVAVVCPDCFGFEPEIWDCETCRGGKVPG